VTKEVCGRSRTLVQNSHGLGKKKKAHTTCGMQTLRAPSDRDSRRKRRVRDRASIQNRHLFIIGAVWSNVIVVLGYGAVDDA
jgi:hypothetical protein